LFGIFSHYSFLFMSLPKTDEWFYRTYRRQLSNHTLQIEILLMWWVFLVNFQFFTFPSCALDKFYRLIVRIFFLLFLSLNTTVL
jgi:hypothetical protein